MDLRAGRSPWIPITDAIYYTPFDEKTGYRTPPSSTPAQTLSPLHCGYLTSAQNATATFLATRQQELTSERAGAPNPRKSYILIALSVRDVTVMLPVLHFLWQNRPLYITAGECSLECIHARKEWTKFSRRVSADHCTQRKVTVRAPVDDRRMESFRGLETQVLRARS